MRFSDWRGRLLSWSLQLAVLAAVFLAVTAFQTRNLLETDRGPAPVLTAPTLGGEVFDLAGEAGTPVLVYFFAPWCKVCGASADNLARLRRWLDDDTISIVTVALDWRDAGEVQEYADRHGLAGPVLLGSRDVAQDWQIYAFPTYYVLDSSQRIVRRDLGYSTQLGLLWRTWSVE